MVSNKQWRQLCQDCDIINKEWGFSLTDADAVFSAAASRGNNSGNNIGLKDIQVLLNLVAARIGCPKEDIVGLVAWSFGPRLDADD